MSTTSSVAASVLIALLTTGLSLLSYYVVRERFGPDGDIERVLRDRLADNEKNAQELHDEILYTKTQLASVTVEVENLLHGVQMLSEQVQALGHKPAWKPPHGVMSQRVNSRAALMLKIYHGFSIQEINDLAFQLGINPEELSGDTVKARARELVSIAGRRGVMTDLLALVREERPDP